MLVFILSGKNVEAKTFTVAEQPKDTVFWVWAVDKPPQFQGGLMYMRDYILSTIRLPREMREGSWQGRVFVQFIVRKTGKITDVEVIRSMTILSADREAVRVVESMPDWIAGEHNGEKVNVRVLMPIGFKKSDYDWILRSNKSE